MKAPRVLISVSLIPPCVANSISIIIKLTTNYSLKSINHVIYWEI